MTRRVFYILSVIAGILCTLGVWNNMANNPRWALDKGPGQGKLPRVIVSQYMDEAYRQGKGPQAYQDYMHKDVKDTATNGLDKDNTTAKNYVLKAVVAEGLNVTTWYCLERGNNQNAVEVLDLFRTRGARIVERYRISTQETDAPTCPAVDKKAFIGGTLA